MERRRAQASADEQAMFLNEKWGMGGWGKNKES